MPFGVAGDGWMVQDALIWCHRRIVATREMAAAADFLAQLHARLEEVGVEPQELIELVEQLDLVGLIVAIIAHGGADDGVVLLLDEAVVVLAIGAAAGKADMFLFAIAAELVVDELPAVV